MLSNQPIGWKAIGGRVARQDAIVTAILALLSLSMACMAVVQHFQSARDREAAIKGEVEPVSATILLANRRDFLGSKNSNYTLVEFADYQCPPCRAANERLPDVLADYRGRLRLDYRNFPLTQIHANAMNAALAAEAARAQGKFWPMHDQLMLAEMNVPAPELKLIIEGLVTRGHLDKQRFWRFDTGDALSFVEADLRLGSSLGIRSTPSFVLCCPNDRVIHLASLDQLKYWIGPTQ